MVSGTAASVRVLGARPHRTVAVDMVVEWVGQGVDGVVASAASGTLAVSSFTPSISHHHHDVANGDVRSAATDVGGSTHALRAGAGGDDVWVGTSAGLTRFAVAGGDLRPTGSCFLAPHTSSVSTQADASPRAHMFALQAGCNLYVWDDRTPKPHGVMAMAPETRPDVLRFLDPDGVYLGVTSFVCTELGGRMPEPQHMNVYDVRRGLVDAPVSSFVVGASRALAVMRSSWNADEKRFRRAVVVHDLPVASMVPLGPSLVATLAGVSSSKECKIWNWRTGELEETLGSPVVGISPLGHGGVRDDGFVGLSAPDGGLFVRRSATAAHRDMLPHQRHHVETKLRCAVACTPLGDRVALGNVLGHVQVLDFLSCSVFPPSSSSSSYSD